MNKKLATKGKDAHKIDRKWYMYRDKTNTKQTKLDWVPKPLKAECYQCRREILISFVVPKKDYSWKNNLDFWTEKEKDKGKKICDPCLIALNDNKPLYWKTITNLKKRQRMRTYLYTGTILPDTNKK